MSDPFCKFDEREKITKKMIEILGRNNIPMVVLTKGGSRAEYCFDEMLKNNRKALLLMDFKLKKISLLDSETPLAKIKYVE